MPTADASAPPAAGTSGSVPAGPSSRLGVLLGSGLVLLVLLGWAVARSGEGTVVSMDVRATADCRYDAAEGVVRIPLRWSGVVDGRAELGVVVTAYAGAGELDPVIGRASRQVEAAGEVDTRQVVAVPVLEPVDPAALHCEITPDF